MMAATGETIRRLRATQHGMRTITRQNGRRGAEVGHESGSGWMITPPATKARPYRTRWGTLPLHLFLGLPKLVSCLLVIETLVRLPAAKKSYTGETSVA